MSNKRVVITGASRGIGLVTACKLMEEGFSVALCARTKITSLSVEVQDLIHKSESIMIYLDLATPDSIKAAQIDIKDWCNGTLHGLVNNAGIPYGGFICSTSIKKMREVFEVNFFGHIDLTQRLFRMLVHAGNATIVNVSSIAAFGGETGTLTYGASKLALLHATKVMAAEFAKHNISVNAIAPAITETNMLNNVTEQEKQRQLNLMARQKIIQPNELSNIIYYLINDAPRSLTGQTIRVDGGMSF